MSGFQGLKSNVRLLLYRLLVGSETLIRSVGQLVQLRANHEVVLLPMYLLWFFGLTNNIINLRRVEKQQQLPLTSAELALPSLLLAFPLIFEPFYETSCLRES